MDDRVDDGVADRLLGGLTAAQRQAVTSDAGLLCVLAGAGSGKTTVLTRRIAWRASTGAVDPSRALVVTFTRAAGAELRSRLGRLGVHGVWAGTFHGAAYAQLRRHWADTGVRAPAITADPVRLLARVVAGRSDVAAEDLGAVATEISWARARAVGPHDYPSAARAARRSPAVGVDTVAELFGDYETTKRRRGVVDVDDLVGLCTELLEAGGGPAAALRWRVCHLFVDEFQDLNPAQWRLLEAWRAGRPDLFVVGDARQAVYAWNGSDPTLLGRIEELVPGTSCIRLDENHRSTAQVVQVAAAVLPPGDDDPAPVPSGAVPDGPPPVVRGFDDEDAESAAVVRWLRQVRRPGVPWRRVAVLARTNARLEPVAAALRAAGIPVCRRSTGPAAGGPAQVVLALRTMHRRLPLRAALVDAADALGDGAAADLAAVAALVDDHCAEEPRATVGTFLAWLAANPDVAEPVDPGADGVELATFHRSKGLEWSAVAVVGLEDGLVPIAYATSAAAVAEESRLVYVAVTRAERDLWCSWSARPGDSRDEGRPRGPSPVLALIESAAAADASAAVPAADAGDRIAGLRTMLAG